MRSSPWCGPLAAVKKIAVQWGLEDVWIEQRLPATRAKDAAGAWKARLRKAAKRRARIKFTGKIAKKKSRITDNYLEWLHIKDTAPQMEMAEYLQTARTEDLGAKIVFAIRSGTSTLRAHRDRWLRPRALHSYLEHRARRCRQGNEWRGMSVMSGTSGMSGMSVMSGGPVNQNNHINID